MSYIQQILGNNVKKYRIAKGLTMEQLAGYVGINYQNLSKIENGRGFVTANTFDALCSALNISPEQLVSINDTLPEKITNNNDTKELLHQIINNLDGKQTKALYKLVLAFFENND